MAVYSGAYSAKESSAAEGDVYIPTDSFYDWLIWTGGAWKHILNGMECIPPVDSEFTWINQGAASTVTANGGVHLLAPALAGGNLRIKKKTAPTPPYTVTALVVPTLAGVNFPHGGIVLRESATEKLLTASVEFNTAAGGPGGAAVAVFSWASPTASGARKVAGRLDGTLSAPIWLKLADTGALTQASFSGDGVNFVQLYSAAYNVNFTAAPNEIGFFAHSNNATYDAAVTLISWDKPNPPAGGRNYAFWGLGAIGSGGGPNVGIFGD